MMASLVFMLLGLFAFSLRLAAAVCTPRVDEIYGTGLAFAAKRSDGSVITWGSSTYGGDSSSVSAQLASGVDVVSSTYGAFAAKKTDGSVVTWGDSSSGGDSSSVSAQLASGVDVVYYAGIPFFFGASKKTDGSVGTWGSSTYGGDSSSVSAQLASGVDVVYSTLRAFAAKKNRWKCRHLG